MNILDYIDWRGDLTFAQSAFNEVDNLILSTLTYLKMDRLVSEDGALAPTIGELRRLYARAGYDQSFQTSDPRRILERAASALRFRDVVVKWYVSKCDAAEQIQFAAVTYLLTDRLAYIAFRGTDNTIVGWREDCNFSFLAETPGQNEAARYVNRVAGETREDLIVGGHSKGGNFAVYGAAFCDRQVREGRIVKVYSNDGPGFNEEIAASPEYLSMLGKTLKILPDSSLVGILLSSREPRKIIRSDAKGLHQHVPYSWCVRGTAFEPADEQTAASLFMDDVLSRWVATLSAENKQILVSTVFDALEATGATTLSEISQNKFAAYTAMAKAIARIDPERRSDVAESLKKLFASGKNAVISETHRSAALTETGE